MKLFEYLIRIPEEKNTVSAISTTFLYIIYKYNKKNIYHLTVIISKLHTYHNIIY